MAEQMGNQDQIEYWNGPAGEKWVSHATDLDGMLHPFAEAILDAACLTETDKVLDIGCGAGALSLKAAQTAKSVLGLDVSSPLIKLAQKRARPLDNIRFEVGDAAAFRSDAQFDVLVSRFGVMFFHDPASAFSNLRAQLTPHGRLAFACWQSPQNNLWAKAPLEAALPFLSAPPEPPVPHAPGPFAFADAGYLDNILHTAGWQDITLTDWTGKINLPGQTVSESAAFMLKMGPMSKLIAQQDVDHNAVKAALRDRLLDNVTSDGTVDMPAAAWLVTANAS